MPVKRILDRALNEGGVAIVDGGVMLWTQEGNEAWTGAVWVHPDYRRQGLATHMVREVARQAKAAGVHYLNSKTMIQNRAVTEVYRRLGRKMVNMDAEYIYWRDNVDDLLA